MCVGAQRPDVLEAGACVRRCPEARLSLEAGLTYIGASKPPRHAAAIKSICVPSLAGWGLPGEQRHRPSGRRTDFGVF